MTTDNDDDQALTLPDGRTLAYRTCGVSSIDESNAVVFCFHGALGTGNFDVWSTRLFAPLNWFVVTPTLPGWGKSSPIISGNSSRGYTLQHYAQYDVQHLANHIFGTGGKQQRPQEFICLGISYGCVHAIACAVEAAAAASSSSSNSNSNTVNYKVSGLCLLGPHGPFDDPTSLNPLKGMALPSQMGLGMMGVYAPWLTRLTGKFVQNSVSTPTKAKEFVQKNLLNQMNSAEKQQFESSDVPQELKTIIESGQGLRDSLCSTIEGYAGRIQPQWNGYISRHSTQ